MRHLQLPQSNANDSQGELIECYVTDPSGLSNPLEAIDFRDVEDLIEEYGYPNEDLDSDMLDSDDSYSMRHDDSASDSDMPDLVDLDCE